MVEPFEPKLEIEKKVDQKSYEPGKPLHYTLTVKKRRSSPMPLMSMLRIYLLTKVLDVG
ncbi:hypothetical protein [Photobacterium leiognathi]|uniref:hypothetical protein n=1 Tax=Photobacterium leiognathi TaxID=553611 RepID=UPI002733F0B1|nr:hypothetical protein [Photobacterium leiognathi]